MLTNFLSLGIHPSPILPIHGAGAEVWGANRRNSLRLPGFTSQKPKSLREWHRPSIWMNQEGKRWEGCESRRRRAASSASAGC